MRVVEDSDNSTPECLLTLRLNGDRICGWLLDLKMLPAVLTCLICTSVCKSIQSGETPSPNQLALTDEETEADDLAESISKAAAAAFKVVKSVIRR